MPQLPESVGAPVLAHLKFALVEREAGGAAYGVEPLLRVGGPQNNS